SHSRPRSRPRFCKFLSPGLGRAATLVDERQGGQSLQDENEVPAGSVGQEIWSAAIAHLACSDRSIAAFGGRGRKRTSASWGLPTNERCFHFVSFFLIKRDFRLALQKNRALTLLPRMLWLLHSSSFILCSNRRRERRALCKEPLTATVATINCTDE